jgi:hypothetical protein
MRKSKSKPNNSTAKITQIFRIQTIFKKFFMENQKTQQISARLSAEQMAQITELFPDMTQKDIITELLRTYTAQPDNSNFTAEIERLQAENITLTAANAAKIDLIEDLDRQIAELQARQPEIQEKVEYKEREPAENQLFFVVPQPHLALLTETAKRLNTQPENILLDMFIRYTAEQWHCWFYDFCITPSEFKEICGYSQKEIKNYLKKVDEQ